MPAGDPFCPTCARLQPPGPEDDPFAALGMPRRFALDPAALERSHRERSRQVHPDRFARAHPRERLFSLQRATRLNDAWRALRDRRRRAALLLALLGRDPLAVGRDGEAAAFLEEQLAARERLARARAGGDVAAARALGAEARARLAALEEELDRLLSGPDPAPEALDEAGRCLRRARYWEALAAEAGAEGGPAGGEGGA